MINMEVDEVEESAAALQKSAAGLLSEIKHVCRTSQKAIDTLVKGVDNLIDSHLDVVKDTVNQDCVMHDGHITLDKINKAFDSMRGQSVFEGIQTQSKLDSYLQEQSGGLRVIMKRVVLESKKVFLRGVPKFVRTKYGYVIPFWPQLEQLLNCPNVLDCVDNPVPFENGVLRCVTHGLFYRSRSCVQKNGDQTLAFIIHEDDVDPCDALKSKANKHNLRLYYWLLANIHPDKRSTLRAINLLAIVKAKLAKTYGNHHFLQDFIEGMKKLGTEGVNFNIYGKIRRFFGILLFASCDNPASANLGGFKETHFALRPCRMCMVKSSDMCEHFFERLDLLRSSAEHKHHVKEVLKYLSNRQSSKVKIVDVYEGAEEIEEDCDDVVPSDDKYFDHTNPSVNYGVNGRSILMDAPEIDITKCLPQDLMHLLAEGIVEMLCRYILRDLCIAPAKKPDQPKIRAPLSLDMVNSVLQSQCDLGHLNVNRPSVIERGHVTGQKLKQSAAQMLLLLRLLPFVILPVCPKNKLDLVLKLIHLVDFCMAYAFRDEDSEKLRIMIEDFGRALKAVYPNVKTLKLHCLSHLPTQLKLHGPLRQQWCFRFESFHSQFTHLVPVVRSKKNLEFTLASRHLSQRNTEIMQAKDSGRFLYQGDHFGGQEETLISAVPQGEKDVILSKFPTLHEQDTIKKVKKVVKHGFKWEEGVAVMLEKSEESCLFGRVDNLYFVGEELVIIYSCLRTMFIPVLNAHEILGCDQQLKIMSFDEQQYRFPVPRVSFHLRQGTKAYLLVMNHTDFS